MPPETILFDGHILTQDAGCPRASALLVRGERIVAVGGQREMLSLAGPHTVRLGLGGRTVLPGLVDAHLHLDWYARSLTGVAAETATRADCLARVRARARETAPGEWIEGSGWNHNAWGGVYGTRAELDEAAPQHAVVLTAKSGHAAWVNTRALGAAGITGDTPDPPGGRIGRAPDGTPDGLLFERAMDPVTRVQPELAGEALVEALARTQQALARLGLSTVHDFSSPRTWEALHELHARGELRLRVVKNLPGSELEHLLAQGLRAGLGDAWLRLGHLKFFADGALGPRTAAMMEPYAGEPGNLGLVVTDRETLVERGRLATLGGWPIAVHAIGDRAVHEVLEAFEALRALEAEHHIARDARRHRIEHLQLALEEDLPRLARLDLVASMQPSHAPSDRRMAERYWGPRCARAYAWRSQLAAGAHLAFGSDAPVEPPNPFEGLHAAVTRRGADGEPGAAGWYPEQRLTLAEALRAYTLGPAYAAGVEKECGILAAGRW
ncbi:MAG: amidohydrolase, partial [Chloroflexi bacterium]|nr:amidohydrolase [Chloroflexota bacterium]